MKKLIATVMIVSALTTCMFAASKKSKKVKTPKLQTIDLPTTNMLLLDNFEDGNYWYGVGKSWDQWGSHNLSLIADLSTDWGTDGQTSLKCTNEPATADTSKQATWCCNSPIETDLSAYNWCAVDVYNPGTDKYNLSIAIQNADDWAWDVSPVVEVGPNSCQTVLFDLSAFPDAHLANVFCFMIQHADAETENTVIYFDNFRLYE